MRTFFAVNEQLSHLRIKSFVMIRSNSLLMSICLTKTAKATDEFSLQFSIIDNTVEQLSRLRGYSRK